jgi:hypothetical protein
MSDGYVRISPDGINWTNVPCQSFNISSVLNDDARKPEKPLSPEEIQRAEEICEMSEAV